MKKLIVLFCFVLFCYSNKAQPIANYVANGSFEEYYNCSSSFIYNSLLQVKYWSSIDSVSYGGVYNALCNGRVPLNGTGYQYPKTGNAYLGSTIYFINTDGTNFTRGYLKNRLKSNLKAGKTYCVRFYLSITNASTYGVDGFGIYFGGIEIDTITKCNVPLSYITPQIQNPQGNIITDTLNWIAVTGTFTANGTEKYLLLGNFISNGNIDTLMINPTNLPTKWTDANIDDVSCMEVDLAAYAGRDTTIYLGDSAYIGREPDFAIDGGCVWYQLPNMTTAIDTISGMWVKPNATGSYTYVVRQELECSSLKWDTVVVTVRDYDTGIGEVKNEKLEVKIFPNPASEVINVEFLVFNNEVEMQIINVLGEVIKNSTLTTKNTQIDVSGLENGIYLVSFKTEKYGSLTKKLVVAK